ncbi:MAG: PD40 domain-containing protein [Verrucomicrobia bacterium]|nr:PD40 domain-containing protein [Verrucomicrobiota bacterium]
MTGARDPRRPRPTTGRAVFRGPAAAAALVAAAALSALAQAGRDWGVESVTYADPVTGLTVTEITTGTNAADNLYFHFSNFTADNRHLLFVSDRTGSTQLFRWEVETGRVVQLTEDRRIAARSACPDHTDANRVYVVRGQEVLALSVTDGATRRVGEIPGPLIGGVQGLTLSGDGQWLALSKQRDAANWEIGLLHTSTGEYRTVLTQGFRIGHVQHSPTDPLIFYVWETGGIAPQRTWLVNADGTGNRPFYARTNPADWFTPLKEWITHEAWVTGTGEMTLINDKLGVMLASKDGQARMVREGRYWHGAASHDGQRIVLDDFEGRLWLAETRTGSVRLLATGLRETVRVHPHPSFDRRGHYVQFHSGRTRETVALIDLRQLIREAGGSAAPW